MKANFAKATLKITAGDPSQFPLDSKGQIAFSGRSNVGKSSLINAVLSRKNLARTSSSPGKTITINFYDVDSAFYLVDLPGYGFAKRTFEEKKKWSSLVDGYFTSGSNNIAAVAQLVDAKVGPTEDDLTMIDFLARSEIPFFIVATKIDKLNKTNLAKSLEEIKQAISFVGDVQIIPFSSLSGSGKDKVINAITEHVL